MATWIVGGVLAVLVGAIVFKMIRDKRAGKGGCSCNCGGCGGWIRCLLALLSLTRLGGEIASKDVSTVLGVSRPSVHRMLELLGRAALTEKKPYGAVKLTEEGLRLAEELEARRDRLLLLFARRFGLSMDQSALAATLLLSGLNEESLALLEAASQTP